MSKVYERLTELHHHGGNLKPNHYRLLVEVAWHLDEGGGGLSYAGMAARVGVDSKTTIVNWVAEMRRRKISPARNKGIKAINRKRRGRNSDADTLATIWVWPNLPTPAGCECPLCADVVVPEVGPTPVPKVGPTRTKSWSAQRMGEEHPTLSPSSPSGSVGRLEAPARPSGGPEGTKKQEAKINAGVDAGHVDTPSTGQRLCEFCGEAPATIGKGCYPCLDGIARRDHQHQRQQVTDTPTVPAAPAAPAAPPPAPACRLDDCDTPVSINHATRKPIHGTGLCDTHHFGEVVDARCGCGTGARVPRRETTDAVHGYECGTCRQRRVVAAFRR